MKTTSRLTHHDYHNICCFLEQEAEVVKTLSVGSIVKLVTDSTGHVTTAAQIREMLKMLDISAADRGEEPMCVLRAMASRLNWPWATLVTEGRKILEAEEARRLKEPAKSPPLAEQPTPATQG